MGLFDRLKSGLSRTAERLARRFDEIAGRADEAPAAAGPGVDTLEALEELLLGADVGLGATTRLVDGVRRRAGGATLRAALTDEITAIFAAVPSGERRPASGPYVVLIVGVNGTGKTTTVGKLAHRARQDGRKTLICAADTFRAAAVDQLQVWATRAGVDIVRARGPMGRPRPLRAWSCPMVRW